MSQIRHVSLDVAGFLANHKRLREYSGMFKRDDGTPMPPDEARMTLIHELANGHRFLPFGECDGFDYQKGCPGHPVEAIHE